MPDISVQHTRYNTPVITVQTVADGIVNLNAACDYVCFRAHADNAETMYLATESDATDGIPLSSEIETPWLPVTNVNKYWVHGTNDDQVIIHYLRP